VHVPFSDRLSQLCTSLFDLTVSEITHTQTVLAASRIQVSRLAPSLYDEGNPHLERSIFVFLRHHYSPLHIDRTYCPHLFLPYTHLCIPHPYCVSVFPRLHIYLSKGYEPGLCALKAEKGYLPTHIHTYTHTHIHTYTHTHIHTYTYYPPSSPQPHDIRHRPHRHQLFATHLTVDHHITTSPHHHITTSPHHHITTSPHHHITTSPHHHITTSPHHILHTTYDIPFVAPRRSWVFC
jgi:hypothetical protein